MQKKHHLLSKIHEKIQTLRTLSINMRKKMHFIQASKSKIRADLGGLRKSIARLRKEVL